MCKHTHTPTQSVGQWKTVAMAAHPEPCCRMIRDVLLLLNQPPLSAPHCCLHMEAAVWKHKMARCRSRGVHNLAPKRTCSHLVARTSNVKFPFIPKMYSSYKSAIN